MGGWVGRTEGVDDDGAAGVCCHEDFGNDGFRGGVEDDLEEAQGKELGGGDLVGVGGWVGGLGYGKMEEIQAVGMRYCGMLGGGWVRR